MSQAVTVLGPGQVAADFQEEWVPWFLHNYGAPVMSQSLDSHDREGQNEPIL